MPANIFFEFCIIEYYYRRFIRLPKKRRTLVVGKLKHTFFFQKEWVPVAGILMVDHKAAAVGCGTGTLFLWLRDKCSGKFGNKQGNAALLNAHALWSSLTSSFRYAYMS